MPVAPETDPDRPASSTRSGAPHQPVASVDEAQAGPVVEPRGTVGEAPLPTPPAPHIARAREAAAAPVGPQAMGAAFAERARLRREERIAQDRRNRDRSQTGPTPPAAVLPERPVADEAEDTEDMTLLAKLFNLLVLLGLLVAVYVGLTAWQVWGSAQPPVGGIDAAAFDADAIVVMGAAQYDGTPSPVLEARLSRALELYQQGAAAIIVPTGSKIEGDRFTEGFAGFTWLRDRGVPEEAILFDVDGGNTWEQITSTASILGDRDMSRAIVVSDSYHTYRLGQIADEAGLDITVIPTDTEATITDLARETAAVSVGRLIGFRRLSNLRG